MKYKVGVGLIVATWLLFFLPIISGQYVYFLDDLKIIYYPIEALYAQFQHNWQLPVWANEFGFGQPLLAWGQLGFFTPLHIIMRALYIPPLPLLQVSVVLYFLIGSFGMFTFLLRRNITQAAAALGAVAFAYCGFNIGHLNHVNFYTSTMLLPWLLVAIDACIQKSTLARATILAIVGAGIIMSGQPQVVLYVFIIATVLALAMYIKKPSIKTIPWIAYAGIVAFLLSSFALFPLLEFIPETERAGGLPKTELFEFSYPPYATITLILPYFFGDHSNYFGPKGFQELAAYLGIIPIMLVGVALTSWKTFTHERIAALALALGGGILVLGKYSVVYQYLVEHHFITSIGVVGRFVFFVDIGMIILASIGLHDLVTQEHVSGSKRVRQLVFSLLLPILLIGVPFGIYMANTPKIAERFYSLLTITSVFWWAIGIGIFATVATIVTKSTLPTNKRIRTWALPTLAAVTLICYGWDYNPKIPTQETKIVSPFIEDLQKFKKETGIPARLYAAEHLPVEGNPNVQVTLSDFISPNFSVIQPLQLHKNDTNCLLVPIQATSEEITALTLKIRSGITGTVYSETEISSENAIHENNKEVCLPQIPEEDLENLTLTLTSDQITNMKVFVTPSESTESNVYFLRVQNPTPEQLTRSIKTLSMVYETKLIATTDHESALMVRHIQALGGASSARWIGALSIRPYREFVDSFFANDSDAFDGDGVHALTRNKKLVDMTGITHFTQLIDYDQTNDPMLSKGYELIREADTGDSLIRLYKNPKAYPKAFVVPRGEFIPANDEIRFRMRDASFDPSKLAFLSGPVPPILSPTDTSIELQSTAKIISYTNTRVDVEVSSNKEAILVVTDSITPEWQTFINDREVPSLRANTIFKAAQVPSGTHTVSFRYSSPAIQKSKTLSLLGLALVIIAIALSLVRSLASRRSPRT